MAGLKKLSTRIINKHATAAVWNDTNFTPLQGEIVIYDPGYDSKDGKTYIRERMKIGDGSRSIQELPFANELDVNITEETSSVNVVTAVSAPTYVEANYNAPSMGQQLTDDILTIVFDAGSYVPAVFHPGEATSTQTIEYLTGVSATTVTPIN